MGLGSCDVIVLMIQVRAPCVDHAEGWQAGVEGLTVQFTHSLNHISFVFATHVDLA